MSQLQFIKRKLDQWYWRKVLVSQIITQLSIDKLELDNVKAETLSVYLLAELRFLILIYAVILVVVNKILPIVYQCLLVDGMN